MATTNDGSAAPRVHHVVYAVDSDRIDATADFFTELGFTFANFVLEDVGLRVMLDWTGGLELVTPEPGGNGDSSSVAEFLRNAGDGVYSVAIRVPEASAAEDVARRYGATTQYRQHREVGTHSLDEIDLRVLGLPVTFLSTDLPD